MPMDDWLKGVIAGSGAVLVATAWSMRSTEKLLKEAEIDFANPEFGVTPKEDFSDSVRQNLAVGGYSFNAESPSGDDPTAADPSSEGGPAELFDESVVQDEQDSGVDFMNAETSSTDKKYYILVDQSGSTHKMHIMMAPLVRSKVEEGIQEGYDVEVIGFDHKAHPYTDDPRQYIHISRGGTMPSSALEYIAEQNGGKLPTDAKYLFIEDEGFSKKSFRQFAPLLGNSINGSNMEIIFVSLYGEESRLWGHQSPESAEYAVRHYITEWDKENTGIPMNGLILPTDSMMVNWHEKGMISEERPKIYSIVGSDNVMESLKAAESPLEVSPLSEDPLTEGPSDMGGPEDFSADEWPHPDINETHIPARYRDPTKEYVPPWIKWARLTPEEKELENASYIDRYGKVPSWIESSRISPEERHSATSKRMKELENDPDIDLRKRKIMTDIENMVEVGIADNPMLGPSNLRGIDFFQDYDTNAKYFIIDADSYQSIMNGDSNVVGYWMGDEWIEIGASETGEFLLSDDIYMISNLWLYYVINPEEILNDSVVSEFVTMNTIKKERKENFGAEMPSWDSSNPRQRRYGRSTKYNEMVKKREKELENDPDIIYETRRIKEDLENLDEIDEIFDRYDNWYISDHNLYDSNELSPLSKEYISSIAQPSDYGVYRIIDERDLSEESIRSGLIQRQVRAENQAEWKKRKEAYIKHLQENYEGVNEALAKQIHSEKFGEIDWYKIRVSDDYVNWEHDTYGDDAWSLKAENYGSKDARRAQWARRMKGKAKHGSESASTDWLIIISAVGELADDTPEIYKMDSKPTEDLMDKIISYHASEFDKPIHRNVYYSGYGKPPGAYAIELTEEYDDELTIHITVVPADKIESINDSRFLRRPTYGGATLMARGSEQNQGYNDRDDESIGVRNTTTGEQSLKDRRDESKGMTGSLNPHHPYSDVSTMSAEELVETHSEMSDEEVIEIIEEVHKSDFGVYEIYPVEKVATAMLLVNRRPHLKEWAMTKFSLEDKDMETMSAEARRWRLPKTSKGTALYAKRDESGRFTDIQNVARSTRADRARIAANQGVKSGKGDEGERMIYEAEFQTLTDHVSTMYAAESQDLILCAHCDKKMSECVPHSSEVFEAPASGYPVFMSAKDAAAVFAKNKNKLCTVTFMKKDGTMRTMRGRTGVFRDKSGKTIVGTGKKPSWDAKARAAAGYMTFFDVEAAKKAGDNRKGFRMINLNTITEIKAMGRTFDGAHPQGF